MNPAVVAMRVNIFPGKCKVLKILLIEKNSTFKKANWVYGG
jgi:hypothetical protein